MRKHACLSIVLVLGFAVSSLALPPASHDPDGHLTIRLWPQGAPGEKTRPGPERDTTRPQDALVAGKRVIRLTNISDPTIILYKPPPDRNTGAAVVVFPGGGYRILALDLEGTEVCKWLNTIGITGILLKYRVPPRPGVPRYQAPLEDAQRAVRLARFHAKEWHLRPDRIGVIGFSAGGDLAALVSNDFEQRAYKPPDAAGRASSRPDFALLIYPAYLAVRREGQYVLAPELKVIPNAPPTFLVQAEDDPVGVANSIYYYLALKSAGVPVEMHLYAKGGHGYGLRPTQNPVTRWPQLAEGWLRGLSVTKPASGNSL